MIDAPASEQPSAVNILVVDDVPQNLLAMQALLQRPGLTVLTAASGTEALELLLQKEVALALLDVQMPEMDGFALAELMRGAARTRALPIIFLTATPVDAQRSFRGYEAGAVDYLHKPIDPRVIASKVDVFVQLYRQRQLLRDRNEALERLLKLNETMVAVLSHDLRTPLSAILVGAEVMRIKAQTQAERRSAERIKSSSARMGRMIEQLLDFSRIRSGVLKLHPKPNDLESVCRAVLEELQQSHPEARVEFTAEGDLHGVFDADRLAQVVGNLLGNALQHGGREQPVRLTLDGRDPAVLQGAVLNAGQLPEHLLGHLFDPFKPGNDERREGLGLGLYIVDQFLRAHGGQVNGSNTPQGALLRWRLPRHPAP